MFRGLHVRLAASSLPTTVGCVRPRGSLAGWGGRSVHFGYWYSTRMWDMWYARQACIHTNTNTNTHTTRRTIARYIASTSYWSCNQDNPGDPKTMIRGNIACHMSYKNRNETHGWYRNLRPVRFLYTLWRRLGLKNEALFRNYDISIRIPFFLWKISILIVYHLEKDTFLVKKCIHIFHTTKIYFHVDGLGGWIEDIEYL